jgi:putative PIN family toxin of toxin-antitoxin system
VRIVLDTKVFISATVIKGKLARLAELWTSKAFRPLASLPILKEYRRVLAYPKLGIAPADTEAVIRHDFLPFYEAIENEPVPLPFPCRDSRDDIYLQAALVSKADFLISGDKDLLNLNGKYPFPIIKPADFLASKFL